MSGFSLTPPARVLLRIDGSWQQLHGPQTKAQIEALIGSDSCEPLMLFDRIHVMVIDAAGTRKQRPVNDAANGMYRASRPATAGDICGDVVIMPYGEYESACEGKT